VAFISVHYDSIKPVSERSSLEAPATDLATILAHQEEFDVGTVARGTPMRVHCIQRLLLFSI
jgi:hypothetical protein